MAIALTAVAAGLIFRGEPGADHLVDDALSELSIGPRHLDADFAIEERWVGLPLEGTLEELEAARISAGIVPGVVLPVGPGVSGGPVVSAVEPALGVFAQVEAIITPAQLELLRAGNIYSTFESRWLLPEASPPRPVDTSVGYYDTTLSTWVFAELPTTTVVE